SVRVFTRVSMVYLHVMPIPVPALIFAWLSEVGHSAYNRLPAPWAPAVLIFLHPHQIPARPTGHGVGYLITYRYWDRMLQQTLLSYRDKCVSARCLARCGQ